MSTFEERNGLTRLIEREMPKLFPNDHIREFGCTALINDPNFSNFLRSPEVNQTHSGMLVKFAPDFLLLRAQKPKELFFVDIKHSVSPIWAEGQYKKLLKLSTTKNNRRIELSDIGVIAREALLAYRRYYPNTIIIMGSPYNPKVLMAQFVDKIQCFHCYSSGPDKEYDCDRCPVKLGNFFDFSRVENSAGSKTPYVNVDLGSFEPITEFFETLNIRMDPDVVNKIVDSIKEEKLLFSSTCNEFNKNRVRWTLNQNGCDWIKYKIYTRHGNDFIHLNHACNGLKIGEGAIEKRTISCLNYNKRGKCVFCWD